MCDIHITAGWPYNRLSNLYPHRFEVDGEICESMEGLLQSLKFKDEAKARKVRSLHGAKAKRAGYNQNWWTDQELYWKGVPFNRHSEAYANLRFNAYLSLAASCPDFVEALMATETLEHSIGGEDPLKTILTRTEFLDNLSTLKSILMRNE